MLFIVSGASGVGKSTLCTMLMQQFDTLGPSVSYTTRPPRGAEIDGDHYHFVDHPAFEEIVAAGGFAEYAEVHGNYYGTTVATIDAALSVGRSVLFDIDYQGSRSLKRRYPEAVTVMVLPPSFDVLEQRLRCRGTDAPDVVSRRLIAARHEIAQARDFEYLVVNDDIDDAYQKIQSIYAAGHQRTERVLPFVREAMGLRSE
ncbi:MAG: guanylate kinase [Bradymonadia bacterium]|jgi:guanylate kinase